MSRSLRRIALACVIILLAPLALAHVLLRLSLPALDGRVLLEGPSAPVRLERDALGVTTVSASNRLDLAFGTGFAHGQDRFFQMDLSRRLAAGELSELFGSAALEQDRKARVFRFRTVARAALRLATPEQRALLAAYTRGVNAGLAQLRSRPWEYWLLRIAPAAWRDEDTYLVVYAMWWDLQYADLQHDRVRWALNARLGGSPCAGEWKCALLFLYPSRTEWDSPNFGAERELRAADARATLMAPIPTESELSVRGPRRASLSPVRIFAGAGERVPPDVGSNNWAVAGRLTGNGAGLIASDMHLGLRVPPVWYHMRLRLVGASATEATRTGADLDLNGVTLPGAPLLVAGSNGHAAWAFTNSAGHWLEVRPVSCLAVDDANLQTREASLPLTTVIEEIAVRGRAPERLAVRSSALGVLVEREPEEQRCWFARWLALSPAATNMNMLALERARTALSIIELAPELGIPHQNLVAADDAGHIGWALAGRIPEDAGPARLTAPSGWRTAADAPHLYDPPLGRVWSANARATDDPTELAAIGGEDAPVGAEYALGARARQIRDALLALGTPVRPTDMLRIQLDDRALFLERWRGLMLELLDTAAVRGHGERQELRTLIEHWDGRAGVDSVGYRIVRSYHSRVSAAVWSSILRSCAVSTDEPPPSQFDQPLWTLVTQQPVHLLEARYAGWRDFLLAELDDTAAELRARCGTLARCRWGEAHPVLIRHPLARAVPLLSGLIDLPALELPGDHDMPRVQDRDFGASERFAIAPGHESGAYLHLPGGQSGHPLSPYYHAGFLAWAHGEPLPLLPGPPQHALLLSPAH